MKKNEPELFDSAKASFSEHGLNLRKDGVDLSLIKWMLSMTPTERLQTLQQNVRSIMRLRGGGPGT